MDGKNTTRRKKKEATMSNGSDKNIKSKTGTFCG